MLCIGHFNSNGAMMLRDFRNFLMKENFIALALAVVLGAAVGKVVQAIVDDFIMPVIGAVTPAGDWQKATWNVGSVKFGVGDFASVLINFIIIALVVWRISKLLEKPAPPPAMTKDCPFCRMSIDAAASRCPHCTSELAGASSQ
jgi:large conductance mechanosensitive channel